MSSPMAQIEQTTEQLASIAGRDHVHLNEDGSITVSPADTKQVSEILVFSGKNHLTVYPQGGGTKRRWGSGAIPNLYLSLARLNRVIEHPWQDLTCTVQAGCTWSKLQRTLATHGQFIALDPLFEERSTVGGVLASNDSGALRQRYGSLRDLVIGMTLVLPDGTIARTGGKVVKNVAGYDLCKLLTGSLGTLAIITEANFRLHPLPQHTRSFTIAATDASQLGSLLAAIRSSHLLTQAVQLRSMDSGFQLDVQLSAHPTAHQEVVLAQMTQQEGLDLEDASEEVWKMREALFPADATVLRISTLPAQVCAYADRLRLIASDVKLVSVAQAFGLHTVALYGAADAVTTTTQKIRADAAKDQITVAALQLGAGVDAAAFDVPSTVLSLMGMVKRQFDPDGILNPEKFFA